MVRKIASVIAGLACFAAVSGMLSLLATHAWPAYAAAYPHRAYTMAMLIVRLTAGVVAIVCAAALTAALAEQRRPAALWLGITLLAISLPWHIHIWKQYPAWYHLFWFASLIPTALLGERLLRMSQAGPRSRPA
ncbi:MAG: hypothetical protein KGL44_10980 [Sphingomonadales bacterium]|nr:hypothetical protein [Sphingomonadales bacterium]